VITSNLFTDQRSRKLMSATHGAADYGGLVKVAPDYFAALNARRMLVIGGIALILAGMILGDIFAAFILHPNAARIGAGLAAGVQAIATRDPHAAGSALQNIGYVLENRGTKVDAHVHMIIFGYLALLLALLQPYVAILETRKKFLAKTFLSGALLLPLGVFLIHYVGLTYSPLAAIGWASIVADFGGALVFLVCAFELMGLWRYLRQRSPATATDELLADRSSSGRILLVGGTLLVLIGFFHGAYYAGVDLFRFEREDSQLLSVMTSRAAANDLPAALQAVDRYGQLQGTEAVNIAAHAHSIEFGVLAILLAFFQPYVFYQERWKRFWAFTLLLGSILLPFFVLMEMRWGLLAGGVADIGGLLVIVALLAMLVGVWRYTGKLDAALEVRQ
jgi:hypothetical protein